MNAYAKCKVPFGNPLKISDVLCAHKVPPRQRARTGKRMVETRYLLGEAIRSSGLQNAHPPPVNFLRVTPPPVFATREKVEKSPKMAFTVVQSTIGLLGKMTIKAINLNYYS